MQTANFSFYTSDGATPALNKALSLGMSIGLVFIAAFFYGTFLVWSPFVQLNIVFPAVFGMLIAVICRASSKVCKVRDKSFINSLALTLALFGLYFSWVAYVLELISDGAVVENYFGGYELLIQPMYLWEIIVEINRIGVWSVFGYTPHGGELTLMWLAEAAIIIFFAVLLTGKYVVPPFSYNLNKWYKRFVLGNEFAAILSFEELLSFEGLSLDEKLYSIRKGGLTRFGRVSIYYFEGDDKSYLQFHNIMRDTRGKGETATIIISNLQISAKDAESLIKKFYGKRDYLEF